MRIRFQSQRVAAGLAAISVAGCASPNALSTPELASALRGRLEAEGLISPGARAAAGDLGAIAGLLATMNVEVEGFDDAPLEGAIPRVELRTFADVAEPKAEPVGLELGRFDTQALAQGFWESLTGFAPTETLGIGPRFASADGQVALRVGPFQDWAAAMSRCKAFESLGAACKVAPFRGQAPGGAS